MSRNPFPGPQPYRASDRGRFYGREDLAYRLGSIVVANRCVTVYGPSGAGKSSVMQAAVIPALIESQDVRVVRVDGWPEDQDPALWLARAVYGDLALGDPPAGLGATAAVCTAAQRVARRSPRLVLLYLDQIEQLLYAGRASSETEEFFECLHRVVELPLRNMRVVLSLREDYLGRFRDRLRERGRLLDHGFRVGPLTVADLCGAVCRAAAAGEPPQAWAAAEMRPLMLQVRVPGQAPTDDAEAQSAYAQIVCRALFQERERGVGASSIEAEPILRRYLETTLEELGPLREGAQRLLEEHLVTADGSRTLRTEKELLRLIPPEQLSPMLKALEGAAILHAEEHQGSRYFEIGHDWLARKVFEQRQQREQEEALRQQRAEAEARLAKERARRRTLIAIAVASAVAAAGAGALSFWALRERTAARLAERQAEKAERVAEAAEHLAEAATIEAEDARRIAGFRELSSRGRPAAALKLLAEVTAPEKGAWADLASNAVRTNLLFLTLSGHHGRLGTAALSPNGARVLTASSDRTARVWPTDGHGDPKVFALDQPLTLAAWSPDGSLVATVTDDGMARLWSAPGKDAPKQVAELKGHDGRVLCAAFSPDGKRLVTGSDDTTARVWNAETGSQLALLKGHTGPVTAAAFAAGGLSVATASVDQTVRLWNSDGTGVSRPLGRHAGDVLSLAVSRDGTRLVTTSRDKTARVFSADGKGAPLTLTGHGGDVTAAAFSPDGQTVATACDDGRARVWSLAPPLKPPTVLEGHTAAVTSVAVADDGKGGLYVATGSADKSARLWSSTGGDPLLVLAGHDAPVGFVAFGPDAATVLTAASDPNDASNDHSARVWKIAAALKVSGRPKLGAGVPHSAFLSADGKSLLSAFDDGTARLARLDGSGEPASFSAPVSKSEGAPAAPAPPPGAQPGLPASLKGPPGLPAQPPPPPAGGPPLPPRPAGGPPSPPPLPVPAGGPPTPPRPGGAPPFPPSPGAGHPPFGAPLVAAARAAQGSGARHPWVANAALSPAGDRVVLAVLDKAAVVLRADGGGEPVVLPGHGADVRAVAWSSDGTQVVTACEDRKARVFQADGRLVATLEGHTDWLTGAAFSADGKRVVTASLDGTARVWSVDGGKELAKLPGHKGRAVEAAAFSPKGDRVAVASSDGWVGVWDAEGKTKPVEVDTGARDRAMSLAWSRGGDRLAASVDRTILVWSPAQEGAASTHLELVAPSPVLAVAFLDDQQVLAAGADGSVHTWLIDIPTLAARLKEANVDCLSPELRQIHRREDLPTARRAHAACEASFGRTPALWRDE